MSNILINEKMKLIGSLFFIYTLASFIFSYIHTEWIGVHFANESPSHVTNIPFVNNKYDNYVLPKKPKISNSIRTYPSSSIAIKEDQIGYPCALLFFGLPKQFAKVAYPSIKKNILAINPTCDVFVHTYNITTLGKNPRNNEPKSKLNVNEVFLMTKNVVMDTDEDFLKARNLTFYRKYFPFSKVSWEYPLSMDNMIKQWHSIESVWNFMEEIQKNHHSSTTASYYKRIGLFRIDLEYMNPINISHGGNAVLPDFGLSFPEHELNDRLFYGSYNNAKIWSHRFDQIPSYFQSLIGKEIGGLHSETMIYVIVMQYITSSVLWKAPICARRIRVTGHIEGDCWCKETTNSTRELPCIWWGGLLRSMNKNNKYLICRFSRLTRNPVCQWAPDYPYGFIFHVESSFKHGK